MLQTSSLRPQKPLNRRATQHKWYWDIIMEHFGYEDSGSTLKNSTRRRHCIRQGPIWPASFFCRHKHSVWILIGTLLKTIEILTCLLYKGADPSLVNNLILTREWYSLDKWANSPNLQSISKQAVPINGIIPVFVKTDDLLGSELPRISPILCSWAGPSSSVAFGAYFRAVRYSCGLTPWVYIIIIPHCKLVVLIHLRLECTIRSCHELQGPK